jgi:hypothetical protein
MCEPVTSTVSSLVAACGSAPAGAALRAGRGAGGGVRGPSPLTMTMAPEASWCTTNPLPASRRLRASSVDIVPSMPAVRRPRSWSAW